MQTISIKSGASATISISPKVNGEIATAAQLSGVTVYVFFVHQFTSKIFKEKPFELTAGPDYELTNKMTLHLTSADTAEMLGNADENQRFEVQFAVRTADGEIVAEEKDSNVVINITRWEAGKWLSQAK